MAARLLLTVPGAPGASEVRLTQIAIDVRRPDGSRFDLAQTFERFIVASGATHLLETAFFDTTGGRLVLPLTIAKTITSGAPESVDLAFDLRGDAALDSFTLALVAAAICASWRRCAHPRSQAQPAPPGLVPAALGHRGRAIGLRGPRPSRPARAHGQHPGRRSEPARRRHASRARGTAREAPTLEFSSWTFRTLGDRSASRAAWRDRCGGLFNGATLWRATSSPPDSGSTVRLALQRRFVWRPATRSISLVVEWVSAPTSIWLRFALDATAFGLRDATSRRVRSCVGHAAVRDQLAAHGDESRLGRVRTGGRSTGERPARRPGLAAFELRMQHLARRRRRIGGHGRSPCCCATWRAARLGLEG